MSVTVPRVDTPPPDRPANVASIAIVEHLGARLTRSVQLYERPSAYAYPVSG